MTNRHLMGLPKMYIVNRIFISDTPINKEVFISYIR